VGRVTRYSPKPKPKYLLEVTVKHTETGQAWIWEKAARIAGSIGYKRRTPFWAITIIAFCSREKAVQMEGLLREWRHDEELREARRWPCPVRVRYEEAAFAQYAVIWGLSTGIIRNVARIYRRERSNCSTHGLPRSIAAEVILATAPAIGTDKAREMVDAMLAWVIARHARWFWIGLQGERTINWL
jgi:hypothetical protein